MSQPLGLTAQTSFAELVDRAMDASFDADFDERGSFIRKSVKGQDYWYYQRWQDGKAAQTYVGPHRDPEITERVEAFANRIKPDYKQRRDLVRSLLAVGLPRPDPTTGQVVEAFWKAGFFRLRGVLIGTTAYQCYAGLLGIKLPAQSLRTADADFAQSFAISNDVRDTIAPADEIVAGIDPTFAAVAHNSDSRHTTAFRNKDGYRIEFLTPNRGSDDYTGRPVRMPALGGISALPIRFLDFLIHQPVRSVLLHGAGIPVTVPAPERYAIHKLIVADRRDANSRAKSGKDIVQAGNLIVILAEQRPDDLVEAWLEAWNRGPAWRKAMTVGHKRLDTNATDALLTAAASRASDLGFNPDEVGLGASS